MTESCRYSSTSTEDEREKAKGLLKGYLDKEVSQDVIIDRYSETGPIYETIMAVINYSGHTQTASMLGELYPSNRDKMRILDVAAGTGLCCIEMKKLGFENIDAFDAAEGMLEEAKKKELYQKYIHGYLGNGPLEIESNIYDAITISGICSDLLQKFPILAFEELIRIAKPGAHIINTAYRVAFADDNPRAAMLHKNMKKLEEDGKFKLLKVHHFTGYLHGEDGEVRVHQVC